MGGYRYHSYISYFLLFTITNITGKLQTEIICECRKSSRMRLRNACMGIKRLKTKQNILQKQKKLTRKKTTQVYIFTRTNKNV